MARRALGPATQLVVQALEAALTRADTAVLVACSGGADSLALAAAVRVVSRRTSVPARALVVDHGLQADSAAIGARTLGQLEELGLAAGTVRVSVGAGAGPEAAAREARYRALEASATLDSSTVLLGHTLDDQAETVLLGLARGSGPRSLAAMAERSGRWLRPLLGLRRSVTEQACRELGLDPWSDPHNTDVAFTRVRARTRVLPVLEAELGPRVVEALARTARLCRDDADLLDQVTAVALQASQDGRGGIRCEPLTEMSGGLRRRVLRAWLEASGGRDLQQVHVVAVERLVTDWHGQQHIDLPGVSVVRHDGVLGCTVVPRPAGRESERLT